MTDTAYGDTTAGASGQQNAFEGDDPVAELLEAGETKKCAKPGCENTFTVSNTGFGKRRKFCDEHKTPFTGFGSKKEKPGEEAGVLPETGERRPGLPKRQPGAKASHARVRTDGIWSDAVGAFGSALQRTDYVPVGRAIEMTSPVAGEIIEEATKGTFVDKLIQPVARGGKKWQELFDLIGFWGAIGYAQQNPLQANIAMQFARKRLIALLPRIGKQVVRERKDQKAAVEAIQEVMPELVEMMEEMQRNGVAVSDPIDALLMSLFAMPEGAPEPQPANA